MNTEANFKGVLKSDEKGLKMQLRTLPLAKMPVNRG
jgi:hypothetical protein